MHAPPVTVRIWDGKSRARAAAAEVPLESALARSSLFTRAMEVIMTRSSHTWFFPLALGFLWTLASGYTLALAAQGL
jgi:hypothetical protein